MTAPEFSRMIDLRQIGAAPLTLEADEAERAALAKRFSLVSLSRLTATVSLFADGAVVTATGRMKADWIQPCAISGEDLVQWANEPLALKFVPAAAALTPDEELEITEGDCDEIDYSGTSFDLGEAVSQSLALAIDPFAEGPEADKARKAAGIMSEDAAGPFSALAALKLGKDDL